MIGARRSPFAELKEHPSQIALARPVRSVWFSVL